MNTQEALNIIKQVVARFNASGADHDAIRAALAEIERAIAKADKA